MLRVAVFTACAAVAAAHTNGSVFLAAGKYVFRAGVVDPAAVAFGYFSPMNESVASFGSLSITTNAAFVDLEQMAAAGYLEGALTQEQIFPHYSNIHAWLMSNFGGQPIPPIYQDFFDAQDAWARLQVASNSSLRWASVGLILAQLDGLLAGYSSVAPAGQELDMWAFQQIQAVGDFLDLIPALQPGSAAAQPWDWHGKTVEEILSHVRKTTHCSSLFATTGNFSDIFFAHVAWFEFLSMSRVLKNFNFNLQTPGIVGQQMSFSSYPALLSSLDDFYIVHSSSLAITETTNNIFNLSLYKLIVPTSLFAWQRVRLANLLANSGDAWGNILSFANSGSYNNAYGVLDLKGWSAGMPLLPGMLTLAEQIPGLVVYGDVTQQLERGYFPMYNVPYWPEIYNKSGYKTVLDHHRDMTLPLADQPIAGLDYQLAPRAQIFRRDHGKVVDMPSMLALMRYNDYKNDPYSKGSPWNAICSRGDLAGSPGGCYDGKASSASLLASKTSLVINGPTRGNGSLPAFSWAQFPNTPHAGLPEVYDFEFAVEQPHWTPT